MKKNEVLPKIKKYMLLQIRKWFQSLAFWPKSQIITFVAEQTPLDEILPWPMPVAEATLLLQVYILSQAPDYKKPKKWQKLMEQFCFSFPDFRPPEKMYWTKEPLIN